jgi:hypothetical protein
VTFKQKICPGSEPKPLEPEPHLCVYVSGASKMMRLLELPTLQHLLFKTFRFHLRSRFWQLTLAIQSQRCSWACQKRPPAHAWSTNLPSIHRKYFWQSSGFLKAQKETSSLIIDHCNFAKKEISDF